MAASTSDLITQVVSGSTRPASTTVTATRSAAGTTLTVASLTGWETSTKVHFATYSTTAAGVKIDSSQCDWSGIVSGSTITNLTLTAGTDVGNSIGQTVECMPTAAWADELARGILVHANPDGTLKDGAVDDAAILGSDVVTTPKILNAAVTMPKIFNPYRFRAYSATNQNGIVSGTWTTVTLGTEDYDPSTNFASNTYTAPVTGLYHFDAQISSVVTGGLYTGMGIRLWKNGTTAVSGSPQDFDNNWSADFLARTINDTIPLTAGDTIVLQGTLLMVSGTGGFASGESTRLSGYLVAI